jgi:hypothetical protein
MFPAWGTRRTIGTLSSFPFYPIVYERLIVSFNSRLESSWTKIKQYLRRSMALDESIVALMMYQDRVEIAWKDKLLDSSLGTVVVTGTPPELQRLANRVSAHAFDLVNKQWILASTLNYRITSTGSPIDIIHYVPPDQTAVVDCQIRISVSTMFAKSIGSTQSRGFARVCSWRLTDCHVVTSCTSDVLDRYPRLFRTSTSTLVGSSRR